MMTTESIAQSLECAPVQDAPPAPILPVPPLPEVRARLTQLLPEGWEERAQCTSEMAANVVRTLLYAGATAASGVRIRPSDVTDISRSELEAPDLQCRQAWQARRRLRRQRSGFVRTAQSLYAPNTRETVRATIQALARAGLVVQDTALDVNAPYPRYALADAALPLVTAAPDPVMTAAWQARHLSLAARQRTALLAATRRAAEETVSIALPNGARVQLPPGQSAVLTRQVVESFAARHLENPAVVWLSDCSQRVIEDRLASLLGLAIGAQTGVPDVVLADVAADGTYDLVLVEVVSTGGALTPARKAQLEALAQRATCKPRRVRYVSAFTDRQASAYRRLGHSLAWGSEAWFAAEPERLVRWG